MAFFEKITHERDTMVFAFIRIERPQSPDYTSLKESLVQYVLKIVIYLLPIVFLIFEVILLDYFSFSFPPDAETVLCCFFVVVIVGVWLVGVHTGIDRITDIINNLARRTF